jgi:ABC-2 type transport system ATP-binding protein
MANGIAIETRGITKSYNETSVLAGVDLAVPAGTVFALLGPNGAGKTTTVRVLATLLAPDDGVGLVAGYNVVTERHEVRRRISLTGQYAALDELQTGFENLEMMARLLQLPARRARERTGELLERLDLGEAAGRRVSTYSGGMRRRLDLAASLLGSPEVMFLDEPTTGLDPRSRQAIWELIENLTAAGVTILLTTQYLEEADRLADRIAVLDRGAVVAEGSADGLKQQIVGERLDLQLIDAATFSKLTSQLGTRAVYHDRSTLTIGIASDGTAATVRALLDELDPERARITRFAQTQATLDDVFMTLTGQHTSATESETTNV